MAVDPSLLTRLALTNLLLGQAASQANLLYQEAMTKEICVPCAGELVDMVLAAMAQADAVNDCISSYPRARRKKR